MKKLIILFIVAFVLTGAVFAQPILDEQAAETETSRNSFDSQRRRERPQHTSDSPQRIPQQRTPAREFDTGQNRHPAPPQYRGDAPNRNERRGRDNAPNSGIDSQRRGRNNTPNRGPRQRAPACSCGCIELRA